MPAFTVTFIECSLWLPLPWEKLTVLFSGLFPSLSFLTSKMMQMVAYGVEQIIDGGRGCLAGYLALNCANYKLRQLIFVARSRVRCPQGQLPSPPP